MVHPTGAVATVRAIAGARLETIHGLGHDLPTGAWPTLLDLIDAHVRGRGPTTQATTATTATTARRTDASTTA
jgi:hypothetical protein